MKYTQIKYSIVLGPNIMLHHPYPIIEIAMKLTYLFSIIKLSIKNKVFPFIFIKNGKKEIINGIPDDINVLSFAGVEVYSKSNLPIKTEVEYYKGKKAISMLKKMVKAEIIPVRSFGCIISDPYFYIRKETRYLVNPPESDIIVAISVPKIARDIRQKIVKEVPIITEEKLCLFIEKTYNR